jgi:hypothetical protein
MVILMSFELECAYAAGLQDREDKMAEKKIDVSRWEKTPNGMLHLSLAQNFHVVPLDGNGFGVRVEAVTPAIPSADRHRAQESRPVSYQFALSTAQARRLGEALVEVANRYDAISPPASAPHRN